MKLIRRSTALEINSGTRDGETLSMKKVYTTTTIQMLTKSTSTSTTYTEMAWREGIMTQRKTMNTTGTQIVKLHLSSSLIEKRVFKHAS